MSLLCSQVEEKIKQTHRKYLLQEQLKIIKKVEQTVCAMCRAARALDLQLTFPVCHTSATSKLQQSLSKLKSGQPIFLTNDPVIGSIYCRAIVLDCIGWHLCSPKCISTPRMCQVHALLSAVQSKSITKVTAKYCISRNHLYGDNIIIKGKIQCGMCCHFRH